MSVQILLLLAWLPALTLRFSAARAQVAAPADSLAPHPTQDLGDLWRRVRGPRRRPPNPARDSARRRATHSVVVLPAVAYTLEARLLATLTMAYAFRRPGANVSDLSTTLTYTQNQQIILAFNGPFWTADNRSLWLSDWRLLRYPQLTYGLGSDARVADALAMNYNFLRLHQSYYHRVGAAGLLYLGGGYFLDRHWNIRTTDAQGRPVAAVSGYTTGVSGASTSSGFTVSALRDTRANQLRPAAGENYFFLALRNNLRRLGSDANYQELTADLRHYLRLGPPGNVLAFWGYGDFIRGSEAPFLDLPATGWDTYSVTGRGYIQGRFRGLGLAYTEAEYRFNLTRSRVLGGAVFANAQTTRHPTTGFGRVVPAGGAGLRLCLSKKTSSYLAVDYAFGVEGSRGVFFNLGEVF